MSTTELSVTTVGVVGTEPNHIRTAEGADIASFRMAVTERRYDRKQEKYIDGETSWVTVKAWNRLAANVADSVHKRDRVIVRGRLVVKDWQDDKGRSGTTAELTAEALGHDLLWGTSVYTPKSAGTPAGALPQQSSEPAAQAGDWGAAVPFGADEDLPF
ncbi:MAG: Single-stranded DNA-binding protein 1 [Naasia sp.]|nr:Single-stranded DNA-binding protein 1 [Naasia sp.]